MTKSTFHVRHVGHFVNMQIKSKSAGLFLLSDYRDEKAPVCAIWCFYHNPNTMVLFWTLAPLLLQTLADIRPHLTSQHPP